MHDLQVILDRTLTEDMVALWTYDPTGTSIEEALNNNDVKRVHQEKMREYCHWRFNRCSVFNNYVLGPKAHIKGSPLTLI